MVVLWLILGFSLGQQELPVCIICGRHRQPWLISECKYRGGLVCDSCCDRCFKENGNKCLGLKRADLKKHVEIIRELLGIELREEDLQPYAAP